MIPIRAFEPSRACLAAITTSRTASGSVPPFVSHITIHFAPSLGRRTNCLQCVLGIGSIAIEEVFGIVDDFGVTAKKLVLSPIMSEVLLERDAQDLRGRKSPKTFRPA